MRHLDLFSGIGGFALAARRVWGSEHEIAGFCEIDPFCQKVLKKHWPKASIYDDVRTLPTTRIVSGGAVDLITGGFPCQPFSQAGLRRGKEDDRDLWPAMFRVIAEIRPAWVIGENVANFVGMELERSASDLESQGYEVQPFVIPATAVGAPQRRDRCWIVAHAAPQGIRRLPVFPAEDRQQEEGPDADRRRKGDVADSRQAGRQTGGQPQLAAGPKERPPRPVDAEGRRDHVAHPDQIGSEGREHESAHPQGREIPSGPDRLRRDGHGIERERACRWPVEPPVGRVAHGIPHRVDRVAALGNAIVPQVAAEIMTAIKSVTTSNH